MTIEEKVRQMLEEQGLHAAPLSAAMAHVRADSRLSMEGRWQNEYASLAPPVFTVLWISVKMIVGEWLDANLPNAFFRANFD